MYEKLIQRLTDTYNKDPDSNIGKLLKTIAAEIELVNNTIDRIEKARDVDEATEDELIFIGRNVNEYKESFSTAEFRERIKTKIRSNLSGGDAETINEVARMLMDDDFVSVKELYNDEMFHEPAALLITFKSSDRVVPFLAIERILAGGVNAYWQMNVQETDMVVVDQTLKYENEFLDPSESTTVSETDGVFYVDNIIQASGEVWSRDYAMTGQTLAGEVIL